jgi:phosphatidylglycerophosphate synthase
MSKRISHSLLDPLMIPLVPRLYRLLPIPRWFPPEGIIAVGHLVAIAGAVGFACSTRFWWGGLLAAAGVAGNHLADMIDGTHARQTGQCRNGGELLDHFTDPLSFSSWMIGIGLSIAIGSATERGVWMGLLFALATVLIIYATAVLTNIRAKLVGQFTLARFGPTEFKTLLVIFGLVLCAAQAIGSETRMIVVVSMFVLLAIGLVQLLVGLVRAVREVNTLGDKPDTSEWNIRERQG